MNIEERLLESSANSSELSRVKTKSIPWSKKSFILNNLNAKFRDKRLMNRFKRMVYDFDHSVNFYTVDQSNSPTNSNETLQQVNRHKGASHLNKATLRLDTGEAKHTVEKMKETFTNFRHIDKCPISD